MTNGNLAPEVEALEQAISQANIETEQAEQENRAKHRNTYYSGAATAERDTIYRNREAKVSAAWDKLAESADPLLSWIAREVDPGYRSQAREVLLSYRPGRTSVRDLDSLARRNGYCGVWGNLKRAAQADGALNHLPQLVMSVNEAAPIPLADFYPGTPGTGIAHETVNALFNSGVKEATFTTDDGTVVRYWVTATNPANNTNDNDSTTTED